VVVEVPQHHHVLKVVVVLVDGVMWVSFKRTWLIVISARAPTWDIQHKEVAGIMYLLIFKVNFIKYWFHFTNVSPSKKNFVYGQKL